MEEYEEGKKNCIDTFGSPVEEYEIRFIEGDSAEEDLAKAFKLDQNNLELFFDCEILTDRKKAELYFLLDVCGMDPRTADQYEVSLFDGDLDEAAVNLFDEIYLSEIPGSVRNYIDYKAFARDLKMGGDFVEFEFGGVTYTCTNANDLFPTRTGGSFSTGGKLGIWCDFFLPPKREKRISG
jgi:hypothetical protein